MSRTLERGRTALVVVDVQEAFGKAVEEFDRTVDRCATLVRAARIFGLPVVVTEQYPKGLGDTVEPVREALGDEIPRLSKTVFAASRAEGFDLRGAGQALVCGIEAHVCVSQTVHDLLDRGVEVHVAADACTSRAASDKAVGLHKMEGSGAVVTSVETALFELLGQAGGEEFKAIQGLIL